MHAHESLDRLDYALGIANEIAIDLLRWQVLDQAGEMQYLAARLTHGGKTMALLRNPGEPRIDVALVVALVRDHLLLNHLVRLHDQCGAARWRGIVEPVDDRSQARLPRRSPFRRRFLCC
jgi:hypothetical protein